MVGLAQTGQMPAHAMQRCVYDMGCWSTSFSTYTKRQAPARQKVLYTNKPT